MEHLRAVAQRLAKVGAPTGRIMNSWMSRLLLACAPPLMMFIIGTGITGSRPLAEVLVQRLPERPRRPRAHSPATSPSIAFAPSRRLVIGAVELDHLRVDARLVARVLADERLRRARC